MADAALKLPPPMTVAEFVDWPGDVPGLSYELVDGVPRAMAPARDVHGTIHTNLASRIDSHLEKTRPEHRLVTAPGIQPRLRAEWNYRIPELGVTCTPNTSDAVMMPDPLLLIEVLSPGNADDTWGNIALYSTIPSVQEILVVHSTAVKAELLRRASDRSWPENPVIIDDIGAAVQLNTIDLLLPMAAIYRNTHLLAQG